MNITLLSLSLTSYFSNSPFYTIQKHYENRATVSIINSYVSFSYSNFLFSNSAIYQTFIKQNTLSFFLKTPLLFIETDQTEKPTVYKNQIFTNRFQYLSNNKIIIASGTFKECRTEDNGAGLLISQNCEVLVHGVVFQKCQTDQNGGGMYISAGMNEPTETSFNTNFNDNKISKAEIQYCCFSHCLAFRNDNNIKIGFGAGAMVAGENVNFLFVSTNNHFESGEQKLMSR